MINLHFSYSEDDYIPAMRAYLMHKSKFIGLFMFLYLLSISLLMFLLGSGAHFDTTSFIVCAIGSLLGFIGLFLYALPHQRFQHSFKAVDEYWFHVAEHGIIYETEYE